MSRLRLPVVTLVLLFLLSACQPAVSGVSVETQPVFQQGLGETPPAAGTSQLLVEIEYTGTWYRETFSYGPDAPNIRHLVYIVPEEDADNALAPGWAFTSLGFSPYPEPLVVREDRLANAGVLEYMYEAPGGLAEIDLPAGSYFVAVAFIAAALPPPGGDVVLYPGVTGGGASTDFEQVSLAAGEARSVRFILSDRNGWGCISRIAYRPARINPLQNATFQQFWRIIILETCLQRS